jgi:DNA-binding CsgD family transcriptional regulator
MGTINGRRHFSLNRSEPVKRRFSVHPRTFIFFDKLTGTQRFEVPANRDGSMPADYAASLLAVQCLVRGKMPQDFMIMIAPGENLLEGVDQRAMKLIHAGQQVHLSDVILTCRQKEVLRAILQSFSNKEIGSKLNVTERTVKFHVSALLMKFNVIGRVALMRKVTDLLSAGKISIGLEALQFSSVEQIEPVPTALREDQVHLVRLKRVAGSSTGRNINESHA